MNAEVLLGQAVPGGDILQRVELGQHSQRGRLPMHPDAPPCIPDAPRWGAAGKDRRAGARFIGGGLQVGGLQVARALGWLAMTPKPAASR